MLRRAGIGHGSPVPMKRNLGRGFDISLSIGGDNYSLGTDGQLSFLTMQLMNWAERALRSGTSHVLWGASVGPFESNPKARSVMAEHLSRLSLITAREQHTCAYLAELGCAHNTVQVADPAFMMEPAGEVDLKLFPKDKLVLGVNLSELAVHHTFNTETDRQSCRQTIVQCLQMLLDNPEIHLLMVPHVCSIDPHLNDHFFMSELTKHIERGRERITILPQNIGGPKTKAYLAKCGIVIAARMHCAVGALSCAVPTLLIQYSTKAAGMAQYAYGNEDFCLPLATMTPDSLKPLVTSMIAERETITARLRASRPRWEEDARLGAKSLTRLEAATGTL